MRNVEINTWIQGGKVRCVRGTLVLKKSKLYTLKQVYLSEVGRHTCELVGLKGKYLLSRFKKEL